MFIPSEVVNQICGSNQQNKEVFDRRKDKLIRIASQYDTSLSLEETYHLLSANDSKLITIISRLLTIEVDAESILKKQTTLQIFFL